jgi:DNA-binding PucR family transcriptional regulator
MGLELLLKGQARQDVLAFAHNILAALVSDPRHRVLRETLLRYVQEGKSVTRSAHALGIHPNTLYQRLQRIEAVTGRNIADASDFTLLSLACQIHAEYLGETTSPESA